MSGGAWGSRWRGAAEPAAWNRPRREVDIDDAKGVIALLARLIGAGEPAFRPLTTEPMLHPGRSATRRGPVRGWRAGDHRRRSASSTRAWPTSGISVAGSSSPSCPWPGSGGGSLPSIIVEPLPRVQPIERDLTVDVPDRVPAADVAGRIRDAGGPLLRAATLAGTYRGKPLGPDERSLTYRLRFGAGDRAIDEAEIEAAVSTITASLEHHLGARIRS